MGKISVINDNFKRNRMTTRKLEYRKNHGSKVLADNSKLV